MEARTVSVEDAAKQLGIGRSLAYELARHGKLPGVIRLGNKIRVSRTQLDAFIDAPAERELVEA